MVKWEGNDFVHDTWERESKLLKEAPDLIFKYNDDLGKFCLEENPVQSLSQPKPK